MFARPAYCPGLGKKHEINSFVFVFMFKAEILHFRADLVDPHSLKRIDSTLLKKPSRTSLPKSCLFLKFGKSNVIPCVLLRIIFTFHPRKKISSIIHYRITSNFPNFKNRHDFGRLVLEGYLSKVGSILFKL